MAKPDVVVSEIDMEIYSEDKMNQMRSATNVAGQELGVWYVTRRLAFHAQQDGKHCSKAKGAA